MSIRWICSSRGESRDNQGYWHSVEGRFDIAPQYRHTVYPDSYKITDYMDHRDERGNFVSASISHDRIRDCKSWAERKVNGK